MGKILGNERPDLVKEWDYEKNSKSPFDYALHSNTKVWWLCEKGHSWEAIINNRTGRNTGCKECHLSLVTVKDSENSKHKAYGDKLYRVWAQMRHRCQKETCDEYKNYGGRGISVCEEWDKDFTKFYEWAIEAGYEENLSIDRKDVNGNYEPLNCRWTTVKIQNRNKRTNNLIDINGEKKTAIEWSEEYGVPHQTISARVRRGYTGTDIIFGKKWKDIRRGK
jgi:hypothetical protein